MIADREDLFDLFAELPRPVQVAILSHLHGLRSRPVVAFTDCPDRHVVEVIEWSGLLAVEYVGDGVRFRPNQNTPMLRENLGALLNMVLPTVKG